MLSDYSNDELMLWNVADEVLHYVWDPLRICGMPQARDEYHSYLLEVVKLLCGGADEAEIAAFLQSVATEGMGLELRPDHHRKVARILLDWKEWIWAESAQSND